jgi:isopenicillin N synthase-like dioxygenase
MEGLPVVDIGSGSFDDAARAIDDACRRIGFFYVVGHGVSVELQRALDDLSRSFFASDDSEKASIAMSQGGRAWRGWFPVGGELTSGVPDRKEGIYFGAELPPSDVPLHGPNLFPSSEMRDVVLAYLDAMTSLGHRLMSFIAVGLGLPADHFARTLTTDPTILFRIFHYPPDAEHWGVGEHTDYGLLTMLLQDAQPGLQVRSRAGSWIDASPIEGSFVCNIGDMLQRMTGGRYLSTPHRVLNTSGKERLSFPFFFDPSWNAEIEGYAGTYGEYLVAKVSKVFPALGTEVLP